MQKCRTMRLVILAVTLMLILASCAPKYACKGTIPGTKCIPLSDVYSEQVLGEINEKKDGSENQTKAAENEAVNSSSNKKYGIALVVPEDTKVDQRELSKQSEAAKIGEKDIVKSITDNEGKIPILKAPKIARVWIAPWIDNNGDLNMDSFIYIEIEGKKWVIGEDTPNVRSKESIEKNYTPLKK